MASSFTNGTMSYQGSGSIEMTSLEVLIAETRITTYQLFKLDLTNHCNLNVLTVFSWIILILLIRSAHQMPSALELMAISFGQCDSLGVFKFEPDYIWIYEVLNLNIYDAT